MEAVRRVRTDSEVDGIRSCTTVRPPNKHDDKSTMSYWCSHCEEEPPIQWVDDSGNTICPTCKTSLTLRES
jgi:predicted SprT family Zn-dependent metalloprotease